MFSPDDTIVAIATPPGRGGIGIVRISGADACRIAAALIVRPTALQPRLATFARLSAGDEVVVTVFPSPRSYTGQHVVEVSAHGSPVVLEVVTDPEVPPLPPHITLEQAKHFLSALRGRDPHSRELITESFKQKVLEFLPGR